MRENLEDVLKKVHSIFPDASIQKIGEVNQPFSLLTSLSIRSYAYRISRNVTFCVSTVNGNVMHSKFLIGNQTSTEGVLVINSTSQGFCADFENRLIDGMRVYCMIQDNM